MMKSARNLSSFDLDKLAGIIYGSVKAANKSKAAFDRVEKTLGVSDMSKLPIRYFDSNQQSLLREGFRTGSVIFKEDQKQGSKTFKNKSQNWCLANSNPFGMTRCLFIPSLKLQGTNDQIAHWLPLAESGKIVATYAQTELGHGTHVGGINTTATFDVETDEFVINTPTLEGAKFWPGAIGYACSHVFLVARMIIAGEDLGVHSFIVQIRSLKDFKPMPGVELGDIGMKMAYNTIDNGYAIFHNVRIPRTQKLMRYSTVSRDGSYTTSPFREKLLFGGMLRGRVAIIENTAFQLAQALTIATRYSTVRLQGKPMSSSPHEPAIITYKHQQNRLLSGIAKSYVMLFASRAAAVEMENLNQAQLRGEHGPLSYTHMLMCGLKAWFAQTTAEGTNDARLMCGGHGFMAISGLPEMIGSTAALCTFEGENFVMWGQVGRYLWKEMSKRTPQPDLEYVNVHLKTPFKTTNADILSHETLIKIFQSRAAHLISKAHKLVSQSIARGISVLEAENKHALDLLAAGRAHIELFILTSSISALSQLPASTPPEILTALNSLITLFALSTIASPLSTSSASFLVDNFITGSQLTTINANIDTLVEGLLPDAIALTDAWNFSDASMASALGCYDGDVCRRIMSWVKQLQINVDARKNGGRFGDSWEDFVKPMISSRL